ncbi:MAG: acyl-CoA dehydrogenase family protein [Bdellovibrionales bacterium]|nr:acyl-CoA dehydrogenase family protein [Bdellovibrionales bacterium]
MSWQDGFQFDLDDETKMIQEAARAFAQGELLPLAEKIDHEHYFPREILPKLGQLGFMGATVPADFGGSELSQVAYCLIIEELAAACASTSIIVSAHNSLCLTPIVDYGSDEQKKKFAEPLARGEKLGCFALSEPSSGSDAAAMDCTVKKSGDTYVVNGTKNWITNGPEADTCVLFAMLDRSAGYKGICAFVHDLNLPGVSRGKPEDKLGICGSPTCSIMYDGVELTRGNLLSTDGNGFRVAMTTLNSGRTGVAAQAVGIARAALRDALAYSKERVAFGKPICEHQSIQNYLAEMVTKVDAARYLTLGAARKKDRGESFIREASMAKLYASRTAVEVADLGVQIHGGYGYVKDYPAERHLRDAKITEIYEGTSEIQKMVIAGHLLKE